MKVTSNLNLTAPQVAELLFEEGSDFFAQTLRELYILHEKVYKEEREKDKAKGLFRWLVDGYGFSLYVSDEIEFDSKIVTETDGMFSIDPLRQFIEDLHSAMWYRQINHIAKKKAA